MKAIKLNGISAHTVITWPGVTASDKTINAAKYAGLELFLICDPALSGFVYARGAAGTRYAEHWAFIPASSCEVSTGKGPVKFYDLDELDNSSMVAKVMATVKNGKIKTGKTQTMPENSNA